MMVSTHNYLRPADVLPNSADGSKNPLEMLEKTCQQIGCDLTPRPKHGSSTIRPAEHADSAGSKAAKLEAGASESKSTSSRSSVSDQQRKPSGHRSNAPGTGRGAASPSGSQDGKKSRASNHSDHRPGSSAGSVSPTTPAMTRPSSGAHNGTVSESIGQREKSTSASVTQTLAPTLPATIPQKSSPCVPCPSAAMTAVHPTLPVVHPSLLPPTSLYSYAPGMLPSSLSATLAAMHPGMGLRPPGGCADPSCKVPNCGMAPMTGARCPLPGCAQCLASAAAAANFVPPVSGVANPADLWMSLYPFMNGNSAIAALSASGMAAMGMAAGNNNNANGVSVPTTSAANEHTCNWVTDTGFCGKRFTTAEELLQHLKAAHTSVEGARSPGLQVMANPNIPACFPGLAGLAPFYSNAPDYSHLGRMSPRSYHNASLMSLNRFHPYIGAPNGMKPPASVHMPIPPFVGPVASLPGSMPYALSAMYARSGLGHP